MTNPNNNSKQPSLKEWAMAGGGVPREYEGRAYEWHKKVQQFAAGGGIKPAAYIDGNEFVEAAQANGLKTDNATLNKIVDRVNKGESVRQAAKNVAQSHAAGGEIFNTVPDMADGGEIIEDRAYSKGGEVRMNKGGKSGTAAKLLDIVSDVSKQADEILAAKKAAKEASKPSKAAKPANYSPKVLESTAARFADKISAANPKMSDEEVAKKAMNQATKKLEWERTQKPALEKRYGDLVKSSYSESNVAKQQNTPEVVKERMRKANEFLDQPTEAWKPPKPELQAFDRASIKDALEGFPGVEQSKFPRDTPSRANIKHVEGLYTDPENRALIEKQIKRGLPLGGESFYASLYPVKQAVLEAGMPPEKFEKWIHSLAPASARNSIMNEMAVGQFLRDMNARGIPLTEENVAKEMALYKEKFGIGLPLMPLHHEGVAKVLEGGQNLRDQNLANIPTNYKIPTYGSQKAGDFANSVVLDVHEAGGQTQGSRYHPYFNEQGGFGNTEYNAGEQGLLGIAQDLGIPGGMAQAGRWFGGGELTGLKSPRGDALDLLEKQVAYTLKQKGVQPNPANVRAEVLRQIETGEGDLLPWYRKEGMPDVRETGLQRAEGGEVHKADGGKIVKGVMGALERASKAADAAMAAKKADMPTARIGLEAPGILIPSKMNNVREAVRNIKGNYGARRVERAADEIRNLERMYQEDALKQAFTGDNAAAMMTLNPARFEEYATPINSTFTRPNSVRHTSSGERVTYPEYIEYLRSVGGFDDVPFLQINKQLQGTEATPFISGHEGRHRNRALSESGEKAGLVQLLPRSELREPFPRRTQEDYIEALRKEFEMTGNIVLPQMNPNQPHLPQRPAIDLPDIYAKGGAVEKHFDGGGIAASDFAGAEDDGGSLDKAKLMTKILADMAKEQGSKEVDSLKKPRALTDLLNRGVLANNPLSAGVDIFNMGLGGIDAVINAVRPTSLGELVTGKQDKKYLSSDKPFLGSEHLKGLMDKYNITSGEDRPMMETALSFASPTAMIKGAMKTTDLAKKSPELLKKASDALTSSKIPPLATEAKTAQAGKPTGATYATRQEGPFYRVIPATLDQSTVGARGVREASELQAQGVIGAGPSSTGQRVPKQFSDEEVAGLISSPENKPLKLAQNYTKEQSGSDFMMPEMPASSLAKQSAIGRTHMAAVEGSPAYKDAIYNAYAQSMPNVLEQAGAKNYDDLLEKAYRQLAKETSEQFDRLPVSMSFHRSGEGNYKGAKEMASDVHGNQHLYVFQGGDKHDFLNQVDPSTGLNENEKFRAVHDLFGHAIRGNEFGPLGEEIAWGIHKQMYSPLAQLAMTAETRGQNSVVNYTPLNAKLKAEVAQLREMQMESRRRRDAEGYKMATKAIEDAFQGFQYAPQKAILLPPEYLSAEYKGGMPDYVRKLITPEKGTETQSVLTHYSHSPDLMFTDPRRYGTGIKGEEAERLSDPSAVRDRSYFYMGEPGTVSAEPGLGVNRYRGEASSLYDITQDPLDFRVLARESNRTPYTSKYNQGITSPLQDANDMERLVREYGYQGMANPKASKPMAIMFDQTPVQRKKRGGLSSIK